MSQKQRMTTEEIKAHVEDMFKQFDEVDTIVLTIQGVPKVKNPNNEADRYAEMAVVGGLKTFWTGWRTWLPVPLRVSVTEIPKWNRPSSVICRCELPEKSSVKVSATVHDAP